MKKILKKVFVLNIFFNQKGCVKKKLKVPRFKFKTKTFWFSELQEIVQVVPQTLLIMASTMNPDLLAKSSRFLFSVLEASSESLMSDLNNSESLGQFNEALKQSYEFEDQRTSFILLEILSAILSSSDEECDLNSEHSHELCDTICKHLSEPKDMNCVQTCAKICSVLWTNACHLDSFELLARIYLNNIEKCEGEDINLQVIKDCLRHFLTLHSSALLSSTMHLSSPVIGKIVDLILVQK